MVTLTLGSGPPKRQIIELAFGDIGSAGYEFGRTPDVVALSLAERICGMMGATLATEARNRLARGMALLNAFAATIPTMPIAANTPRGAGARSAFGPFIVESADDV
jgi:hypothetical protein